MGSLALLAACSPSGNETSASDSTNSAPVIQDQQFNLDENSAVATQVGQVLATDAEQDSLRFSIVNGNDAGAFDIDTNSGMLQVADTAPLDYETTPVFALTVRVADAEKSSDAVITIHMNDLNESVSSDPALPIVAANATFSSLHFRGSGNCSSCHNGLQDAAGRDVSIQSDWSTSVMANASRDPFWRAKVASEMKRHPQYQSLLDDVCSRCHAPMANVEATAQGDDVELFSDGFLNPTNAYYNHAMDGVSCMLCHQIEDDGKLASLEGFSGKYAIVNLNTSVERTAFGQYQAPLENPMVNNTNVRPAYAAHMSSSAMCATCHNLKTPYLDSDGKVVSTTEASEFPEQMIYTEWEHSDFDDAGSSPTSCQDCHMPKTDGVKISTQPPFLAPRDHFSRHTLMGANTTLLDMLNANAAALGVTATGFDAAILEHRQFLQGAASIRITSAGINSSGNTLEMDVQITNLSGHKLPAGYPSRRVYVYVRIENSNNQVVFESGRMDPDGRIQGLDSDSSDDDYENHYDLITSADQVQAYESIMADTDDQVTYTLLRGSRYLKDNRLLPAGFDKTSVPDDISVVGAAFNDGNFTAAGDQVHYRLPVSSASLTIRVELRYQAIAYGFVRDLFQDTDNAEVARFKNIYDTAGIRYETIAADSLSLP